eukprot:229897-Chlamydomonas_euryale.AAC.16
MCGHAAQPLVSPAPYCARACRLILTFGLLKNFVWASGLSNYQSPLPAETTPTTAGAAKDSGDAAIVESSGAASKAARKRTPKA